MRTPISTMLLPPILFCTYIFQHEIVTGSFSRVWQKLGDDNWKIVHEQIARQEVFPTG